MTHHIALAWNTSSSGALQLWLDGESVFTTSGLDLWTGDTYAKVGIYGGEQGAHGSTSEERSVFDSWIYRVQLSDASLDEVAASSGFGPKSRVMRTIESYRRGRIGGGPLLVQRGFA